MSEWQAVGRDELGPGWIVTTRAGRVTVVDDIVDGSVMGAVRFHLGPRERIWGVPPGSARPDHPAPTHDPDE